VTRTLEDFKLTHIDVATRSSTTCPLSTARPPCIPRCCLPTVYTPASAPHWADAEHSHYLPLPLHTVPLIPFLQYAGGWDRRLPRASLDKPTLLLPLDGAALRHPSPMLSQRRRYALPGLLFYKRTISSANSTAAFLPRLQYNSSTYFISRFFSCPSLPFRTFCPHHTGARAHLPLAPFRLPSGHSFSFTTVRAASRL